MRMRCLLFILLFCLSGPFLFAQEETVDEEPVDERFTVDTPVILNFDEEEKEEPKKKKKVKKKVFYGVKTRKGFTRKGYGNRITYELFYVLKKPETPQTFVRDIYWYDYTRREIRKTEKFDPEKGVLLHGPYEKRIGDVVVETGIFYKGTRHGRWMYYDSRDSSLVNKEKYFRGWPKESVVSYYDADRKKMKEITPIVFGEKDGYYFRFFENGQIAIMGEYQWDQRIGDWTEFYPNKRRKRIIAYPAKPFEESFTPYIKAEWNEKGKQIYRNNKTNRQASR
jgi:antitoxin component YwqK of YwqJK toxin-antitoxin module